jgi:hypothetical protein
LTAPERRTSVATMTWVNLPSFADTTLLALLIANALICLTIFLLAGPTFIAAKDAFGRHVVEVPIWKRLTFALALFAVAAYLALQALLVWEFWPYYADRGERTTERVVELVSLPEENPTLFWITTEGHRFGVTREIYRNLMVGDTVDVRYRPVDDTLFELTIVERAQP